MSCMVSRLRDMRLDDLPRVARLEAVCFTSPWSAVSFRCELESGGAWMRVAESTSGGLAGYLLARLYVDAWHILDLAVAPEHRRTGVASALLREFLECMAPHGIEFTLEVRTGNAAAIALYEGLGFRAVGLRRGYYADTGEDALLMTLPAEDWPIGVPCGESS